MLACMPATIKPCIHFVVSAGVPRGRALVTLHVKKQMLQTQTDSHKLLF